MPYAFSGVGKSETSDVMARVMGTIAAQGEIAFSTLLQTYYFDADADTLHKIVATLSAMKYCTLKHSGTDTFIVHTKSAK